MVKWKFDKSELKSASLDWDVDHASVLKCSNRVIPAMSFY